MEPETQKIIWKFSNVEKEKAISHNNIKTGPDDTYACMY